MSKFNELRSSEALRFKAMKFWIGDHEKGLYDVICERLLILGYTPDPNIKSNVCCIATEESGVFNAACHQDSRYWWNNELSEHEEINIDWLRTPAERKIVTVGDQKYYEDELAPALKGIKPIN